MPWDPFSAIPRGGVLQDARASKRVMGMPLSIEGSQGSGADKDNLLNYMNPLKQARVLSQPKDCDIDGEEESDLRA